MILDVLFCTPSGILDYHHKLSGFLAEQNVSPTQVCAVLRSLVQAADEAFGLSILYIELGTVAISILPTSKEMCVIIHEIVDGDMYGAALADTFTDVFRRVVRPAIIRGQSLYQHAFFSQINSHFLESARTSLVALLTRLRYARSVCMCYLTIVSTSCEQLPLGTIFPAVGSRAPRRSDLQVSPEQAEGVIGPVINFANEVIGEMDRLVRTTTLPTSTSADERSNAYSSDGSKFARLELTFSTYYVVKVILIYSGAYLVLIQCRKPRRSRGDGMAGTTMTLTDTQNVSLVESSIQTSTWNSHLGGKKTFLQKLERQQVEVQGLVRAVGRVVHTLHRLEQYH